MIKSMTGFGKAIWSANGKTGTIEIRSLNSKQFDLSMRLPSIYREKEADIRSCISQLLDRGKIDFVLSIDNNMATPTARINHELAMQYHAELKVVAEQIGESAIPLLPLIIKMPDVIGSVKEQLQNEEWVEIDQSIRKAIQLLNEFRVQEGDILEQDITKRIQLILSLLEQVDPFEKDRMIQIRKQLNLSLESALDKQQINRDRFEQELIYYLEKIDVTEEKVRLHKHCIYFLETLHENAAGKKLGFITQEIGREINTLGSKANDVNIQKIVVQMKDELEKIKEQLLNIL